MAKYLCPISTCNVSFTGSIVDIIPPASGHMGGSHNMNFSDQDIITIIQRQADPNYKKYSVSLTSSNSPSHSVAPSTSISKSKKSRKIRSNLKATPDEKKKWWEEMKNKQNG